VIAADAYKRKSMYFEGVADCGPDAGGAGGAGRDGSLIAAAR
jgi:hypothetical protein